MSEKTTLHDTMKEFEQAYRTKLDSNLPIILRLDGKAFHTYTRLLEKPFDNRMIRAMQNATIALCDSIQGCKFGYSQSDEISLLITKDGKDSQIWFDGNIQKIVSVAASICTMQFNSAMQNQQVLNDNPAYFDCRAFNVPSDDILRYFVWRQRDAMKNSVSMLASKHFSHKQLMNLKTDERKALLKDKDIDWNQLPDVQQRGFSVVRMNVPVQTNYGIVNRERWELDDHIPIFAISESSCLDYIVSAKAQIIESDDSD